MALWMTVKQEVLGLAVLLLVFSCVVWRTRRNAGGRGGGRRRRPAFFRRAVILAVLGLICGVLRMEREERTIVYEENLIEASARLENGDQVVSVSGIVTEIKTVEYGGKITLCECVLEGDASEQHLLEHSLYCYVDSVEELKLGMEVKILGEYECLEPDRNPGGFDYRLSCFAKGVCGTLEVDEVSCIQDGAGIWTVREWLRQFGLRLERNLEQTAAKADLGILKAVLLGEKSDLDDDLYRMYQKNGISHVLAISGLHVSVIGMGVWKGLRKCGCGYVGAGLIAFTLLFGYGSMVNFGPSVVRAVFMMGVSFAAGMLGRTYDLPSAMCVPAMGLLLWRPYLLTQAGFQLSFLAVGSIFFPGAYLTKAWKWKGIGETLCISVSLQMVTIPVVLAHSYEIPIYSAVLNLAVVPLMTYVLVSGILGVFGCFVSRTFGAMLLGGAHYILLLYRILCEYAEELPWSTWILGRPSFGALGVYYLCLMIGCLLAARVRKRWILLSLVGFLALVPWPEKGLSITFLDVGQGDSIVLEMEGRTMLVDCGSSQKKEVAEDVLIPFLRSSGICHLDTVVVSHGDQDHVNGIQELLKTEGCEISIGQIVLPDAAGEDDVLAEVMQMAKEQQISVLMAGAGDDLTGVLGAEVEILCLNPEDSSKLSMLDRNESSLVLQLKYGNFRLLLTGDVGVETEEQMQESFCLEPVTVLKVAHHGSAYSTGEEFLEAVKPSVAVFSYGEGNSYGHPAPAVVERCKMAGAEIYETAKSGAVVIWTDGTKLRVSGWLDRDGGI